MTPAGERILTELLAKDLDTGRVRFDGERLLTATGVEVIPRLDYEPDPAPVASQRSAGIRLGSNHDDEDEAEHMTYRMFARLPQERLVPDDAAAARRAARAQRAALRAALERRQQLERTAWPGKGFAKLPEDQLVKKDRRP